MDNKWRTIIEFLTEYGNCYMKYFLDPYKDWFQKNRFIRNEILKFFLLNYASTRQGAPKSFFLIGIHIFYKYKFNKFNTCEYKKSFDSKKDKENEYKINARANPFCSDNKNKINAILHVWDNAFKELEQMADDQKDIVKHMDSFYNSFFYKEGKNKLKGIKGKIVSLFLRDLLFLMDLKLSEESLKEIIYYTFPVDVWIKMIMSRIFNYNKDKISKHELKNLDKPNNNFHKTLSGEKEDLWIINKAKEIRNPQEFNAGAWYFLSHVVGTSKYLDSLLISHSGRGNLRQAAERIYPFIKDPQKEC